jgi:hypothetical protein
MLGSALRCWTTVGDPAPKFDCLVRIDLMWTDMRPLSVRAAHRTEVAKGSSPSRDAIPGSR